MSRHEKAPGAGTPRASGNVETIEVNNVMTNNNTVIDMRQFVQAKNGEAFTTSQRVAEAFSKQHHHVMQKLDVLECSDQFLTRNFSRVQFEHRGNTYDACEMTKDGFMFLVMGFTGKKAAAIKEGYIAAFNWMAEQLDLDSERLVSTVIDAAELVALKSVIADKAKLLPKEKQLSFKHTMHRRLHTRFDVPRTELIPHESFSDACNFVAAYALEGEWISGKQEGGAHMPGEDIYRVYLLAWHFDQLHQIFNDFQLYSALKALGSPVGIKMIDHFKDGHIASTMLQRDYAQAMDDYQREKGINQYRAARAVA